MPKGLDEKISALTLRVESMALTTSTPSKPMADRFVLTLSMDTTGTSLKRMVSVSVIYGITMPEASDTAMVLVLSFVLITAYMMPMVRPAIRIGTRNVVQMKLFFLTLLKYSRRMTMPIVFRFIAYSSPSVTSLMKMSFMRGISSL